MNAGRHPATIPGWAYRYWPSSLAPGIAGRPQQPCGTLSTRTAGWIISVRAMIPDAWSSTIDAVFRRLPMARTVPSIALANAREPVKVLLPPIPRSGVWLFDRGSPF